MPVNRWGTDDELEPPLTTRAEDLARLAALTGRDPGLESDWAYQQEAFAAQALAARRADRLRAAGLRRERLDGDPGQSSLTALEEVLDGAPALPAGRAEGTDDALDDPLGDGLVSGFAAARRLECFALWGQVRAAAGLLARRTGRTRSLRRRTHAGRFTWDTDDSLVGDEVATEVALAAGITMWRAGRIVDAARALVVDVRLPATAALLSRGLLDWARLQVVLTRTAELGPQAAAAVEEIVYATRGILTMSLPRFTAVVDRALLTVDAAAAAERARERIRSRRIGIQALPDGQALLTAVGPAPALTAAWNRLDRRARALRAAGDPRTLDQLRHDLLVTRCTTDGAAGADASMTGPVDDEPWFGTYAGPADTSGARADVRVTISAQTLAALAGGAADVTGTAHLAGHGPIPVDAVADLLGRGLFRCVVVDDVHGTVLGVGRSTFTPGYVPGSGLRRLLDGLAPTCDVPGCTIPAASCDLDHRIPFARGGPTCECNVRPLCRTHHRLKTAGLIRAVPSTDPADPPGTWVWVTRTGRAYTADQFVPLPPDPDTGRPPDFGDVSGPPAPRPPDREHPGEAPPDEDDPPF